MYTKLIRRIILMTAHYEEHCVGGTGTGSGHCY